MKPANTTNHYFNTKDSAQLKFKQGVVYQINFKDCGLPYIGETGRSFNIRCREYMRDADGWKRDRSALSKQAVSNDHKINWVNIKILAQEND